MASLAFHDGLRARLLTLAFLALLPTPATATLFEFTGTMSGDPGFDVGPMSGSFRFRFDDAIVDSGNHSSLYDADLLFLDLSPAPLGNTVFDLGNSEAALHYRFGVLESFWVGGSISGPNGMVAHTDDFRFSYRELDSGTVENQLAGVVESDSIRIDNDPSATHSVVEVPEPSTALLIGSGLLFARRSSRKRQRKP